MNFKSCNSIHNLQGNFTLYDFANVIDYPYSVQIQLILVQQPPNWPHMLGCSAGSVKGTQKKSFWIPCHISPLCLVFLSMKDNFTGFAAPFSNMFWALNVFECVHNDPSSLTNISKSVDHSRAECRRMYDMHHVNVWYKMNKLATTCSTYNYFRCNRYFSKIKV